jgi:signal transduction histidine kinase
MDKRMQAHKLESLGSLVGGIAHDFNNMLTTIIGYGEMILGDLEDKPLIKEELDVIIETGRKAAQLTKQILSFSKTRLTESTDISPNLIVEKMEKILKRMIGEDIELILNLDRGVRNFKVDPSRSNKFS